MVQIHAQRVTCDVNVHVPFDNYANSAGASSESVGVTTLITRMRIQCVSGPLPLFGRGLGTRLVVTMLMLLNGCCYKLSSK